MKQTTGLVLGVLLMAPYLWVSSVCRKRYKRKRVEMYKRFRSNGKDLE